MINSMFKVKKLHLLNKFVFNLNSKSCARYQNGLSPLFSKIVLFEKTNQKQQHMVGLRHPRIYVKNRRKHVVQNIAKGLGPNFFNIINQNGLSPIFDFVVIFDVY